MFYINCQKCLSNARVDGTIIHNQFLLNELELIEPALYLDCWEGATERFVDVLKSKILK